MDLKELRLTNLKAGADDGLEDGQFVAYASTWTRTPDSYGDVVAKGAFADTIVDDWSGDNVLPILFGHDTVDPFSNIGGALELTEDDHGLLVKGQLDLENPKAMQVYRLLKGRRINQLSFAFDVLDYSIIDLNEGNGEPKQARELRKMKLYEISIVPMGANQDTEVLAVKANAQALKAGRTISAKNLESLQTAYDSIGAVLKAASEPNDTVDEASSDTPVQDEAQAGKSAEARRKSALSTAVFIASL